jgi:hypothetical protein
VAGAAEDARVDGGGILGLVAFIREHSAALEADLIDRGFSLVHDLGTPRLSWRLLGVLIRHSKPGSALHRVMDPDGWAWDINSYLLANVIDAENMAIWQRANAGAKTLKPQPTPMYRPVPPGGRRRMTWDEKVSAYRAHCDRERRQREVTDGR